MCSQCGTVENNLKLHKKGISRLASLSLVRSPKFQADFYGSIFCLTVCEKDNSENPSLLLLRLMSLRVYVDHRIANQK